MRKNFIKFPLLAVLFYLSLTTVCHGQCLPGAETSTRPKMWFTKQEGFDRVEKFKLTKKPVLDFNSRVNQHGVVKLGNFTDLLTYFKRWPDYKKLKIYIGMYGEEGNIGVPTTYGKQLMLIFSPADNTGKNLTPATFYRILPDAYFDSTAIAASQIREAEKTILVDKYLACMPVSTIDNANPANICQTCTDNKPTDTRSILYLAESLEELLKEQTFCHRDLTNSVDITIGKNILAFFTAENIEPVNKNNYRISLAFQFTSYNYQPIELEDTYGFSVRRSREKPLDNGQLCPTVCHD